MIDPSLYREAPNARPAPEAPPCPLVPRPEHPMVGAARLLEAVFEQAEQSNLCDDETFKQKLKTKFNQAIDLIADALAQTLLAHSERLEHMEKVVAIVLNLNGRVENLETKFDGYCCDGPIRMQEDIKRLYGNAESIVALVEENRVLKREIDGLWEALASATGIPRASREEVNAAADQDYREVAEPRVGTPERKAWQRHLNAQAVAWLLEARHKPEATVKQGAVMAVRSSDRIVGVDPAGRGGDGSATFTGHMDKGGQMVVLRGDQAQAGLNKA